MNASGVSTRPKKWLARLFIAPVLIWNLQCALAFLVAPALFAPGFELGGDLGAGWVRALGVLFFMWNVPYAVALIDPQRHKISLLEAVIMQSIGLAGEIWIYLSLPIASEVARSSVSRFIIFDSSGLLLLLLAMWASKPHLTGSVQTNQS